MPSTLTGLVIFVALLIPGFVHYSWRRRVVPLSPDSPLLEATNLVAISLVADTAAVSLFALGRLIRPSAFFDPRQFLTDPHGFVIARPGLALRTFVGLLVVAAGIAWLLAARPGKLDKVATWFAPTIVDAPAWYHIFEQAKSTEEEEANFVHVACTLTEGGYLSGILAWYSTDTDETDDRNIVLAPPFIRENSAGRPVDMNHVGRVILSARDILVMEVTLLADLDWAEPSEEELVGVRVRHST